MAEKKTSYWEKLRDPRWQQMRLKIMERDNFECQECGDKTTTLNVHHGYYDRGLEPWEYPAESLRCLCQSCHEKAQRLLKILHREIGLLSGNHEVEVALGFVRGRRAEGPGFAIPVESYGIALGIAVAFGKITAEEVTQLVRTDTRDVLSEDLYALCVKKRDAIKMVDA